MNVYPAETEHLLLVRVAVIGMPSAKWGESPLAAIVAADLGLDERTVLEHCRGKLAGYELPRRAVSTDAIPRNPTGKALKRVLREQFPLDAPE